MEPKHRSFDSQITILRAANGQKSDEHSKLLQNSQTPLQQPPTYKRHGPHEECKVSKI